MFIPFLDPDNEAEMAKFWQWTGSLLRKHGITAKGKGTAEEEEEEG